MKATILVLAAAMALSVSTLATADTVFGEHSWGGTSHTYDDKLLRVKAGKHTVVAKADTAITCGLVEKETRTLMAASHAAAGQECVSTWKTEETATFIYVVGFDEHRAPVEDWKHPMTYKAEFRTK